MSTNQTFEIIDGVYEGPENWKGELDLRGYKETLISLGSLKTVGGGFGLEGCSSLTSLGDLEKVEIHLYLHGCTSLTTLGNLEKVGGYLDLSGCTSLTTLGNLKTVGWSLGLEGCSNLTTLGNLEKVNNCIYLHDIKCAPLKEVQEKSKYYSSLQAHEALNAIHTQEVQETPLYMSILTGILQG